MHPAGSSTRPFLLISFSEGEFGRVSTTQIKMSLCGLLSALCLRIPLCGAEESVRLRGKREREHRNKRQRQSGGEQGGYPCGTRSLRLRLSQPLLLTVMEGHICAPASNRISNFPSTKFSTNAWPQRAAVMESNLTFQWMHSGIQMVST